MNIGKTGRLIADLRKENRLTQEQLGERLGVTNKTVSRWENGNYLPDPDLLLHMAEMFGVSADELLSGERRSAEVPEERTGCGKPETSAQSDESGKPNAAPVRRLSFTREEYEQYWTQKWKKEHRGVIACAAIGLAALFAILCLLKKSVLPLCLSPLCVTLMKAYFHNRMRIYVESYLYDGGVEFAEEAAAEPPMTPESAEKPGE